MKNHVIIGSRGSDLALWQANYAEKQLEELGVSTKIQVIKTQGDRQKDVAFHQMEGKGFFTKEIERALLRQEVDLAVHSHKDLASQSPEGLIIAGVSDRADPSELLIIHPECVDSTKTLNLPTNAIVGTSSPRRLVQMRAFRPDVSFASIRGNVNTRLNKLRNKQFDAILLAKAGISRLGLYTDDLHVEQLSPHYLIPSPAQGVLAYQIRENDETMYELVQSITHPGTEATMAWERNVLHNFEAGCQTPLGVYSDQADIDDHHANLWVTKADHEDQFPRRARFKIGKSKPTPADIVDKVEHLKPRSVFISRSLEDNSIIKRILKSYHYDVFHQSLIDFKPVSFSSIPKTDWIFFSSKNAVKFFLEQAPELPKDVKFAAISNGSAGALANYGYQVDFNGAKDGMADVAEAFAQVAAYQSVLFPQASNSLQSIQRKLPGNVRYHDLVVYDNAPKTDFEIPACEVLVFTSPLNVSTYFKKYELQPHQTVIVIGSTTGGKLEEYNIHNYKIAYQPDELSLLDEIMAV